MLQHEVVERMIAKPSEPNNGRLSVSLQYRFRLERLFTVAPAHSDHRPKFILPSCARAAPATELVP